MFLSPAFGIFFTWYQSGFRETPLSKRLAKNHPTGGLFRISIGTMAEESTKIPVSVASTAIMSSISTNKWLTHLPVFAKCNIFYGNNLLVWERTVQAALRPRKIIHHLTEDGPHEDHPDFMKWTMEEEFVFPWLLDSLAPEHQAQFVSCDTSRKLWESICNKLKLNNR